MINVTKTFLPPLAEYNRQLKRIWKKEWLTNRGELVVELEKKISEYLSLRSSILLTNNGTIPLQIVLNTLEKGEIITTPYSYVATTAAIVWEKHKPIFVDIHPEYLTIDETKIEAAITSKTKAILAVHVYGNPCNVYEIERISKKYGLMVIYDAAHSFGVSYDGKSMFEYGDVSTSSFHATKIFQTGEGGALFTKNTDLFHELFYRHNFGHKTSTEFYGIGINAKMNELQAAMGLTVLPYMNQIIESRKKIVEIYRKKLDFSRIKRQKIRDKTIWNYHYFPVIFETEKVLLKVIQKLKKEKIYPRRYFYPSLNKLNYVSNFDMPISESISERVLCLPLYHNLPENKVEQIIQIINSCL